MASRPSLAAVVLAGALASLGASYRTPNFVVEAPTPQFAKQVGDWAEYYRKQKAIEWMGREMPTWGRPCPLRVTVTNNVSGGATSFAFDRGQILHIDMHIEGKADRLIASVLPHEITHTVFAYYYREPVPRWADEGGSVLSEDEQERNVHDHMVRQILQTQSRAIPLRRLFTMKEYPPDVMVLYAEGYSVTNFLVSQSGRSVFLAFIAQGMHGDWDAAVRTHYPYRNIDELERAWVQQVYSNRRPTQLASNRGAAPASPTRLLVERRTALPSQPILEAPQPIIRAQSPDDPAERPAPRPDYRMPPPPPARPDYRVPPPPTVQLGAPEFEKAPSSLPQLQPWRYDPRSPVGRSE